VTKLLQLPRRPLKEQLKTLLCFLNRHGTAIHCQPILLIEQNFIKDISWYKRTRYAAKPLCHVLCRLSVNFTIYTVCCGRKAVTVRSVNAGSNKIHRFFVFSKIMSDSFNPHEILSRLRSKPVGIHNSNPNVVSSNSNTNAVNSSFVNNPSSSNLHNVPQPGQSNQNSSPNKSSTNASKAIKTPAALTLTPSQVTPSQ
jgi:hypothetical protein